MDTNKNTYTIIYSVVIVVIVAAVLAFAAEALKPRQQRNIEIETKQMILKSVRLAPDAATVADKAKYVEDQYAKYIKDSTLKNGSETLNIYLCKLDSGDKVYIVPVRGVGLWGPIWGYIALKSDLNTIYGTTFDHKGETPGLGAEINTEWFSSQFNGKQIFVNGNFESVKIMKGGANKSKTNEVDAISGGTITSKALEKTIFECLTKYVEFFKVKISEEAAAVQVKDTIAQPADTLSQPVK
jgi:Na+-transporting NADH:ubiquinone oxidoreductase subunit C